MDNTLGVSSVDRVVMFRVHQFQFGQECVHSLVLQSFGERSPYLLVYGGDVVNAIAYGIYVHHAAP